MLSAACRVLLILIDVINETLGVRFELRWDFYLPGAGRHVCMGYGIKWWVMGVGGLLIQEVSPAKNDAKAREPEFEPDPLSAQVGFFSPSRSASSASLISHYANSIGPGWSGTTSIALRKGKGAGTIHALYPEIPRMHQCLGEAMHR